jgi:hypothetical protein
MTPCGIFVFKSNAARGGLLAAFLCPLDMDNLDKVWIYRYFKEVILYDAEYIIPVDKNQ